MDSNAPEAITPIHFLLVRPGDVNSFGDVELSSRKQWRVSQALVDSYWWRRVIEHETNLRGKSGKVILPYQCRCVVCVVNEKAPSDQWMIGRVEEIYPRKDGIFI